jgi:N-acetylglucosamine-6-sulfatase
MHNMDVNRLLSASKKDQKVTYIDIGHMFLDVDGTISPYIMYDFLHLTRRGYDILSREISFALTNSHEIKII